MNIRQLCSCMVGVFELEDTCSGVFQPWTFGRSHRTKRVKTETFQRQKAGSTTDHLGRTRIQNFLVLRPCGQFFVHEDKPMQIPFVERIELDPLV